MQLMHYAKFEVEFQIVPLVVEAFIEGYLGSAADDNCFSLFSKLIPLQFTTTLTKNIAKCGLNLRDVIDKAETWTQVPQHFLSMSEAKCQFDDETGSNR